MSRTPSDPGDMIAAQATTIRVEAIRVAKLTYLERPVYGMTEVDALLSLSSGTARRWIDGYERRGRHYDPVVRQETTCSDLVTWGEFVETRLLAQYRDAGVPMLHMRPVVEGLRQRLRVRYPLATVRPYIDEELRIVYEVQQEVGLEESMRLVVEAGTGQYVLAPPARSFKHTVEFEDVDDLSIVTRIRPLGLKREVVIDPDRRSGAPVVRAVPTDVLAELIRAGEPIEWVARQYELSLDQVLDAWEYERSQAA
jgi:uncharacterized protein (DUF433 family)